MAKTSFPAAWPPPTNLYSLSLRCLRLAIEESVAQSATLSSAVPPWLILGWTRVVQLLALPLFACPDTLSYTWLSNCNRPLICAVLTKTTTFPELIEVLHDLFEIRFTIHYSFAFNFWRQRYYRCFTLPYVGLVVYYLKMLYPKSPNYQSDIHLNQRVFILFFL